MHSPVSLQLTPENVLPGDSEQIRKIKQKLNEVIKALDEAYRLLRADVEVMDFREPVPHASISQSSWKFVENLETGDLELWHRDGNSWGKTYWDIIGNVTRRPSI